MIGSVRYAPDQANMNLQATDTRTGQTWTAATGFGQILSVTAVPAARRVVVSRRPLGSSSTSSTPNGSSPVVGNFARDGAISAILRRMEIGPLRERVSKLQSRLEALRGHL